MGDGVRVAADAAEQRLHVGLHCSRIRFCFPPVCALQLQVHVCGGCHVWDCALHAMVTIYDIPRMPVPLQERYGTLS